MKSENAFVILGYAQEDSLVEYKLVMTILLEMITQIRIHVINLILEKILEQLNSKI